MAEQKPKLALYWAASCGGCEIAVLNLHMNLLEIPKHFDIVFWPCAMDFKKKDVIGLDDGAIAVCLFNGAIRTSENEEMAHLLRRKSQVLVAFGSCAHEGCIPGLANDKTKDEIFQWVYHDSPTTVNGNGVEPQTETEIPEGKLELPEFYNTVHTLDQVVDVDYYIPGCPPEADKVWAVIEAIVSGAPLPEKGSVIGAGDKTCCEECPLEREEKKIKRFYRPWEIIPEPDKCLLDQGILCMGPATRSGCGGKCVSAGMPCRGCYGPPPNSPDQGAKMLSALASCVDAEDPEEVEKILDTIIDPIGYLYRFGLAHSTFRRVQG